MGGKPNTDQQQSNPMDGILNQEQQAKLAACKSAEDLKHFMEQKAMDALSAEQKAEVQKYWEEHDSPQAIEAQKKAMAQSQKEDAALEGGFMKVIDALFLGGRGGVSSLGALAGPPGGGLFALLLGGMGAPTQNGPTPPSPNRPTNNLTLT